METSSSFDCLDAMAVSSCVKTSCFDFDIFRKVDLALIINPLINLTSSWLATAVAILSLISQLSSRPISRRYHFEWA